MAATYPADTFQEGVDLTIEASNQLAQVVRGDANTEITVADGSTIPSIRKTQADSMYFKKPEAWTTGQSETDYLQLKKYTDPVTNKESWWFAKGALASNPIAMGTSPFGDDNWTLYTPEDLFISGKAEYESIYQALKGKAAEAGYNLVRGSFEEGGTLTGTSDVLWYQANGKYYNWFDGSAKTVVAGSTPETSGGIGAGAWVDRTQDTIRSDIILAGNTPINFYGIKPNTGLDVGPAIQLAYELGRSLTIPNGTYISSIPLVQEYIDVIGESAGGVTIEFTNSVIGPVYTIFGDQKSVTLKNVILRSKRLSSDSIEQSGLYDRGRVQNNIENVMLVNFPKNSFQVGVEGTSSEGSYWANYSNIRCVQKSGFSGYSGVYNSSLTGLDSNDSIYSNVVVTGNFEYPYIIGGHNNLFILGGAENSTGAGIHSVYTISGSDNKIMKPYIEYTTNRPQLVNFLPGSDGNKIEDIYRLYWPDGSLDGYVTDSGINNRVTSKSRSGYFDSSISDAWSENLFENSSFSHWSSASAPWGFTDTTGVTRDTLNTVNGANSSMQMTLSASQIQANAYLDASNGASKFKLPIKAFAGNEVYCGVKCLSGIGSGSGRAGGIKVTVISPTGNQNLSSDLSYHNGDGRWQTLSLIAKIKSDATTIIFSLTSSLFNENLTGSIFFCSPVVKIRELKYVNRINSEAPVISGGNLKIALKADGVIGSVTISGTSIDVTNSNVTPDSIIFLSRATKYGSPGVLSYVPVNGSFTIHSTTSETNIIKYMIVNPL